ncbi:hypothetical protein ESCO_002499 [Escovopsis weberi]|uniref:DUF7593 domain-containing protein n=1 Tax=Escovopsis weberi TaxID=150374 RepID=A0A0M8N219_ESCWE|nr:hypothetical protein ESCO_002499 [Escovopsis weberi]
MWDLGRQLPDYYGEDPAAMTVWKKQDLKKLAWEKFDNTDIFFVKVSDLMSIVANTPHLQNIRLSVGYRELLESESQVSTFATSQKWRGDPDAHRYHGFAPRNKYYLNGEFVGEDLPVLSQTSKTPFPEVRVPRRGLVQVFPDDPEYSRICMEQGLSHLVKNRQSSPYSSSTEMGSSPTSQSMSLQARATMNGMNGHLEPDLAKEEAASINGGSSLNGINSPSF